jgi:hypothetical protein
MFRRMCCKCSYTDILLVCVAIVCALLMPARITMLCRRPSDAVVEQTGLVLVLEAPPSRFAPLGRRRSEEPPAPATIADCIFWGRSSASRRLRPLAPLVYFALVFGIQSRLLDRPRLCGQSPRPSPGVPARAQIAPIRKSEDNKWKKRIYWEQDA